MKLLPMLLLNLATVGVALVVYDQVRDDQVPARAAVGGAEVDASAFEQRIRDLEAARTPSLTATGTDPRLLERIGALEAALGKPEAGTDAPADQPALAGRAPSQDARSDDEPYPEPPFNPSQEEIDRFRHLRDAVHRQDRIERNAKRVDQALDKLSLNLSTGQRKKIHGAFTDFEPRVKYFWDQAKRGAQETMKAGGKVDRGEIVETTTALIQTEFAKTIDEVLPHADAEAVAKTLLAGGR